MMRSLFSGVSGLRVHQTKMDVIANNIANVNTVGYKSSRVTFNEIFYQRIQGAGAANAETGLAGTNPMQIGLGVGVASIDNVMTQGASQRTDNATDIMIQGNGFFIVSDNTGMYFTRAGNVAKDTENNLHINGLKLMGWDARYNSTNGQYEIQSGPVQPISLAGDKQYVPPAPTTIVNVLGNLNALEDNVVYRTMEFYDNVGNMYSVDVKYTYHPALVYDSGTGSGSTAGYYDSDNKLVSNPSLPISDHTYSYWSYEFVTFTPDEDIDYAAAGYVKAYANGDKTKPYALAINVGALPDGAAYDTTNTVASFNQKGLLRFDTNGNLIGYGSLGEYDDYHEKDPATFPDINMSDPPQLPMFVVPVDVLDPTSTFGEASTAATVDYGDNNPPISVGRIRLDFADLRQYVGEHTNLKSLYVDGNAPGNLEDISIGTDGKITGRYSNGQTRLLAQISVAKFQNPAGLEKIGNNLYAATVNSGQFDGAGEVGSILGGTLEMANVDLSQEFTEMITTQRGFQANSRVISVSDEMLQELVNLKR